jgi:hypothetical protein
VAFASATQVLAASEGAQASPQLRRVVEHAQRLLGPEEAEVKAGPGLQASSEWCERLAQLEETCARATSLLYAFPRHPRVQAGLLRRGFIKLTTSDERAEALQLFEDCAAAQEGSAAREDQARAVSTCPSLALPSKTEFTLRLKSPANASTEGEHVCTRHSQARP